jgi:hypothetical protein
MLVSTHVAPAVCHEPTSAPGGTSTTRSNRSSLPARACLISCASSASRSGLGRSIGNRPSHRIARRTGLRWGQLAATQTGIPRPLYRERVKFPAPEPGEPLKALIQHPRPFRGRG